MVKLILEKAGLTRVNHFEIKIHIPILEKALNVQIFILDHQFKKNIIYKGESRPIQIYLHLRKKYFDTFCIVCKRDNCEKKPECLGCNDCHMKCRSFDYFDHHKKSFKYTEGLIEKQSPAPCESFWQCTLCKRTLKVSERKPSEHRCTEYQCSMCKEFVMPGHRCFMRAIDACEKTFKYIHFDFECTQEDIISYKEGYSPSACIECNRDVCGSVSLNGQSNDCDFGYSPKCIHCNTDYCGKQGHVSTLVIAHSTSTYCMRDEEVTPESPCIRSGSRCAACKNMIHHVKHVDLGKLFLVARTLGKWLFAEQHKNVTVMAHNMKGYDGIFLLSYLIDKGMVPQTIIL